MNILLITLAIIAGIVVLLLVVALFTKKDYALERHITINKPAAQVFDYVKHLKNMDHYNKWVMIDPAMRKDYRGTDGTEGFAYAWDSDNKQAGQGEQVITKIVENNRVDIRITFIKPFAGVADTYIITHAVDANTTSLTWGFSSKMAYPMNIMLLFVDMAEMLGKDLNITLNNLKQIVEK